MSKSKANYSSLDCIIYSFKHFVWIWIPTLFFPPIAIPTIFLAVWMTLRTDDNGVNIKKELRMLEKLNKQKSEK